MLEPKGASPRAVSPELESRVHPRTAGGTAGSAGGPNALLDRGASELPGGHGDGRRDLCRAGTKY